MQLILKPQSHPELDEIIVTSNLFSVGRQEAPFSDYAKSIVAKLSKRHARLFTQDGKLYVADVGSLNGTTCDGERVEHTPTAVDDGAVLSFGGIAYVVEIVSLPDPTDTDTSHNFKLILTPETLKDQLEPIVISSFPFLVNKNSEVFERYLDVLPEELSYLSRRHAHIFALDDKLCIEDLGSTNGTYVNGSALDEHVRTLADGDLIAFGSDKFVYRAHILQSEETEATQLPQTSTDTDAPTRTIFVDSPTSFIDVYFVESEAVDQQIDGQRQPDKSPEVPDSRKQASVFQQLKRSFFGEQIFSTGIRRAALLLLILGVLGGAYYYWQGIQIRDLEAAMDRADYGAALRIANGLLARNPESRQLQNTATEAMVNEYIPQWAEYYRQHDFESAYAILTEATTQGVHNKDDDLLIKILRWSTSIREFILDRDQKLVSDPFAEAAQIEQLLAFWMTETRQHTRELGRINQLDSTTSEVYGDIFADIRLLRNLELDAQVLRKLATSLDAGISSGNSKRIHDLIKQFEEDVSNPAVAELLHQDLDIYGQLEDAISSKQWLIAINRINETSFHTGPFKKYSEELQSNLLPSKAFLATYEEALNQWRTGQFDQSQETLNALGSTQWHEVADARLKIQRHRTKSLAALVKSKSQPGYEDRLFSFYAELDPTEDVAIIDQLKSDFLDHSQIALQRAQANYLSAKTSYDRYQQAGGIQTELRLDTKVSARFTERATLLQSCANTLIQSGRIYDQVNHARPAAWQTLYNELQRELSVQRSSLKNLEVVPFAIRQRKLELLPSLPE